MIKFRHFQNYRYNYWFSTRLLLPNRSISVYLWILKTFTCISKTIGKFCKFLLILFSFNSHVSNLRRDLKILNKIAESRV